MEKPQPKPARWTTTKLALGCRPACTTGKGYAPENSHAPRLPSTFGQSSPSQPRMGTSQWQAP
eukprot:scaffold1_cov402-Prasinococcus_capsulatus_cf.AAC.75